METSARKLRSWTLSTSQNIGRVCHFHLEQETLVKKQFVIGEIDLKNMNATYTHKDKKSI